MTYASRVFALAFFCAWTTSAAGGQTRSVPAPHATDEAHKTVTMTGCLEASASLPGFRLTNVELAPGAAKEGPPVIGTSGKVLTYEVSAREGVNLSAHAGQRVTVTAIPDEMPEDASRPAAPGGLTGPLPKITVSSIKTLAADCPS